jgi:cysteine synthase A|tara:strand:+ start:530 stop:760 length:231 start_codon:yes stop_codon:yes gene_type:complete
VVNKMIRAPDAASIASMLWLEALMGRKPGASTGTNLWDVFQVSWKMLHRQQSRSIVTVMCDSGERYLDAVNGWLVT